MLCISEFPKMCRYLCMRDQLSFSYAASIYEIFANLSAYLLIVDLEHHKYAYFTTSYINSYPARQHYYINTHSARQHGT